jgi:hypothetical protein
MNNSKMLSKTKEFQEKILLILKKGGYPVVVFVLTSVASSLFIAEAITSKPLRTYLCVLSVAAWSLLLLTGIGRLLLLPGEWKKSKEEIEVEREAEESYRKMEEALRKNKT